MIIENNGATNIRNTNGRMTTYFRLFRFLFRGRKFSETFWEQQFEANWEDQYKAIDRINFTEIFSNRLTNYALQGSSISVDDDALATPLEKFMQKQYKWCQMALGTGRVFCVPYVIADRIYTDIIPQGHAWVTNTLGDDVVGVGVVADERTKGKDKFIRFVDMEYDVKAKTFTIENKAAKLGGREIPLTEFEEWATIEPIMVFSNVDKPLFAVVDCPKDNRQTDKMQGASITFGCEDTIKEIHELIKQYFDEYDLKQSWLGVDRIMLGKDGLPLDRLFKTFDGKSTDDFFQIFSPDIRVQAYKERMLDLFGRLEKQVGTSNGILTPADTANATATQVRRSMYDTLAIVERLQHNIELCLRDLLYIYSVYFTIMRVGHSEDYTLSIKWGTTITDDATERFNALLQANSVDAVSKEEIRMALFPEETPEEAQAKVQDIQANKPKTDFVPDFVGM